MKRPSHRELNGKLKQAQKAASEKRIAFVEPDVILSDLNFAFKGEYLWIVSLHQHRVPEKGGVNELSE